MSKLLQKKDNIVIQHIQNNATRVRKAIKIFHKRTKQYKCESIATAVSSSNRAQESRMKDNELELKTDLEGRQSKVEVDSQKSVARQPHR